jgi:hypothetical protein
VEELAETEILAAHHQVGMHQEEAVALAARVAELPVVWALIQISPAQHLCMVQAALDQTQLQEVHHQAAEATAIHQLQIEVVVGRR